MATILVTWELGLAMGHVGVVRPLIDHLIRQGHRVVAALKDVAQAPNLSKNSAVQCLQAPVRLNAVRTPFQLPSTFAHILHNAGFSAVDELRPMVNAWRGLYDLVRPDLILFQHSPTAILASHAYNVRRMNIGTGFCCPPDREPLPDWRPYLNNDPAQLRRDEQHVRSVANEVLATWNWRPLDRLTDLYQRDMETILSTFPELDHFGARSGGNYWGAWSAGFGRQADWPTAPGRRVFAYLKPFHALEALLDCLVRRRTPTVIYGPTIDRQVQERFQCESLRFMAEPVELGAAGQQCDLAILNATHGTTAAMLLAGKPSLQIPLYLEQQLSADNVVRMGAGLSAEANNAPRVVSQLETLLDSTACYEPAAAAFASRYASFDYRGQVDRLAAHVEHLLGA
jgi:hypothetical protein